MTASSPAHSALLSSSATPSGTRFYFERLKAAGIAARHSVLGATELLVSKVGFGGYRVHEFDPDHREALKSALLGGCNLIDTSTNYTDGGSERLVGAVLRELFESGELKREEVVLISKVGYVQGTNLREVKNRSLPYSDMVEYQTDCWHNISPEFLRDQITNSLERMKVDTIDVLLLHNPEYYMKTAGSRETYYQRIEKAFRHLETECASGRIKYYGISSNTFAEPESRSDFTSLAKVHEIAGRISKQNKFAAIQFPFNLFEAGGALNKNNQLLSPLEFALKNNLGVLTNRPFNAYAKGRLVRLTSFPTHDEVEVKGELHTVLGRAIEMEKRHPAFPKSPQGLQWAHALRDRLAEIDDLLIWKDVLFQQIFPSIRTAVSRLSADLEPWGGEYTTVMRDLLRLVTWDLENLAEKKSLLLGEQMNQLAPDLQSSPTMSQKMLRLYTAMAGIDSVLVGMRTPHYVKDAMTDAEPQIPEAKAVETLMRMQRHRS
jgi:aryl-alcohol dehydrogenase-like predicted oxidoreductase